VIREDSVRALVEAALDQPRPTPRLTRALAVLLTELYHPFRVRDPRGLTITGGVATKRTGAEFDGLAHGTWNPTTKRLEP
jgi:hypothetical protein